MSMQADQTNPTTAQEEKTIAELVREDYRRAEVFKKHGLDFCCGGKKSVKEAADNKGLDFDQITRELEEVVQNSPTTGENFDEWELDFLASYIENTHHNYVRRKLPEIEQYVNKVSKVHGHWRPETVEIAQLFVALKKELETHMEKEEQVLFPYIRQLVSARKAGQKPEEPTFGSIQYPINMMEEEHDRAGDNMKTINKLSSNYHPPEGACNTYQVMYKNLYDFDQDLIKHVHLENNILFPKAIKLEKELFTN